MDPSGLPRGHAAGNRALCMGPHDQRLGQYLLRDGRAGREPELDGLVLRLARCLELHHDRQATAIHDVDGPVGTPLRAQLVEHPPAAGGGWGGHGGRAVLGGAAVIRARGGDDRRPRHGPHPGRRPDLPLRQPGRAPDAPPGRRGGGPAAGDRDRPPPVGRPGGFAGRPGLPDQVPAGVPRPAGLRAHLPGRRAWRPRPPGPWTTGRLRHGRHLERLVGGDRRTHPDRGPTVHRWQHDRFGAPTPARL